MLKIFSSLLAVSLTFAAPLRAAIEKDAMGSAFDGQGASLEEALSEAAGASPVRGFAVGENGNLRGVPVPGSDWVSLEPDDDLGDSDPAAGDDDRFWDRLNDRAFDQVCKSLKLKLKQKVDIAEYGETGIEVNRRLRRYPTGTFAIVDRAKIELSLTHSEKLLDIVDHVPVSLRLGARWWGESIVVRPLAGKKSCDELGTLLKVWDFKTILPAKTERVQQMAVGEVWKMPIYLRMGFGAGVGYANEDMPVSIEFGRDKEGSATVSLYRMSEDKLRFRIRLEQAKILTKGGSVVHYVPAVAFGLPSVEIFLVKQLVGLIDRQIARELNQYTAVQLGLTHENRDGNRLLLEFILDPRDDRQMEQLMQVLRGDLHTLSVLRRMVSNSVKILRDDRNAREKLDDISRKYGETVGRDPSFAGLDEYERDTGNFRFVLPFLVDHRSHDGVEKDRYVIADDEGTEVRVHRVNDGGETAWFDIPFLGQWVKHNEQKTAQVFTFKDATGAQSEPVAVYVHQEGFLRKGAPTARGMVEKADEVMKYAGVAGAGTNARTRLPVEDLFPKGSLYNERRGPRSNGKGFENTRTAKGYKRGVMTFSLAFGAKAVRDVVFAPADTVLKAYANTLSGQDQRIMMELIRQGQIGPDSKLRYNTNKVVRAVGGSVFGKGGQNDRQDVYWVAQKASDILRDLAKVRAANDPDERARLFAKVLGGEAKSDLAYDSILKVFVQLVDPMDLSAEFYVRVDKKQKGEKDVDRRFAYNREMDDAELVAGMSRTRRRFEPPPELND
ncbi:MAG: hypothetical protein CO113_00495 [Elusimicrobia bacterium CG_4_9_14_3_um_filter_62_55]|nr:MAG: hypothetical protein COR54_17030 [Elusimicrobia bacterium CG22_combo_CG10-13_8_21_14_all_63_91]PJA15381.1 MAG: hypothetical protein COX66_10705 [Elusimicrobia bacterium CG_4_10_14_0_2_um_filter_63_34]PJB26934.1 MAG: hypothetical protein CO113_00495 [Elusimicrobia bacterium CG_4_9_14_3_um_filter_62_55]